MNNLYAFILGRKYLLSIAELCAVLGSEAHIVDITQEALIAALPEPLAKPEEFLNRLGGTIKIVKIFNEGIPLEHLAPAFSEYLLKEFTDVDQKMLYGLSTYSFSRQHDGIIRKTLNLIKKELQAAGRKSRFINKNFQNLESAAIKGEKLLQKGKEIVVINGKNKTFLGDTVAIQDFEGYSHRDYDRPARDPKLGMLPPKLAQIMINLSGKNSLKHISNPTETLYDPFVGIGTVLTEGLLLGFSLLGSDISDEVLKKTKINIDWLRNNNFNPDQKLHLFNKDATKLTTKEVNVPVHLVVTETFLGPPVSKLPAPEFRGHTFAQIKNMLTGFFQALKPILKPGTPVVISVLAYKDRQMYYQIPNLATNILGAGYEQVPLIPRAIAAKFDVRMSSDGTLIYDRPDQIVARQIYHFVRK